MNTLGLTELIVLANLALELGVISEALFAMLVLMASAIITTYMAGPARSTGLI